MKKSTTIIAGITIIVIILIFLMLKSCIIQNTKPEKCTVLAIKVTKIKEGGVKDIVFYKDSTEFYYINRGLEQGLNLDSLNAKVLNKTVTLHLAKVLGGITSKHISQLALGDEIIYTEFN
ncbi:hypothetical protein H8K90_03810 [Winogradskyella echinorum]|uniref:Uncharacterized protein n=1 Tax=Winogradskyella echinorum TaxID=538189 RepID=A0ABR6XYB9_9FLAO|nr:hypothetical protein [Winogradskyella echinorum]MBC3845497.1 hypothetical protein [Winogradskyella echinorum]MBC5749845.1 hypothetical protein [Winogradskyella echinorum]